MNHELSLLSIISHMNFNVVVRTSFIVKEEKNNRIANINAYFDPMKATESVFNDSHLLSFYLCMRMTRVPQAFIVSSWWCLEGWKEEDKLQFIMILRVKQLT